MRSRAPPSRRQSGSPRARPTRSQTATSSVQLRPWWKSTVSRIPRTVSVSVASTPTSKRSSSSRSGTPSPLAYPSTPVVRADDDDRGVLVRPRHRVPCRMERRVERIAVDAASRSRRCASVAAVEGALELVAPLDESGRCGRVATLDADADRLSRRRAIGGTRRPSRRGRRDRPRRRRARAGRRSLRAVRQPPRRARPARSRAALRPR